MSSGCGDVLSLADLQTAKKHQIFEAEVITGKSGGVAGGADIDYATNQVTGQLQKTLPAVLRDAGFRPAGFTFASGGTLGLNDADVAVLWPAPSGDGMYYVWRGALPKTIPASSSPSSTGGVAITAWQPMGDMGLRNDLALNTGANLIGTQHRADLAADLNALDRRPDGYGNSIPAVLANGSDAEIDKNITTATRIDVKENQHIIGRGGVLSVTDPVTPALFADGVSTGVPKDNIVLSNVRIEGSVVSSGGAAYGAFIRNSYHPVVKGLDANGFTGATIVTGTKAAYLSNIHCNESRYHPSLVAGGYGVLIGQSSEWIVDGVQFYANGENNGRHLLYITSGTGTGPGDGLTNNVIATNLVAKYADKDDRNMIPINMRQHRRRILSNAVLDGANAGISYFTENGAISDGITNNVIVNAYKYQEGVPIYGIGQGFVNGFGCDGVIDSNLNIRIRLKDGATGLTGVDTVAYKVAGSFQIISNVLTQVPALGYPFIFESGSANVLVSDVVDAVGTGDPVGTTPSAMFRFLGPCNAITIKGVKTSRPMFYAPGSPFGGLSNVTDLQVDYQRKARLSVSSGAVTKIDAEYIIGTTTLSSTGATIVFPSHVTQAAVENVRVEALGPYQVVISSIGAKQIVVNTYTIAGAVLNPLTTPVVFNVILSS